MRYKFLSNIKYGERYYEAGDEIELNDPNNFLIKKEFVEAMEAIKPEPVESGEKPAAKPKRVTRKKRKK